MPYESTEDLPDSVRKHVPQHGQEIYKEAFNSAEDQYGEEDRAHRMAWSAVKYKYRKDEESGRRVSKISSLPFASSRPVTAGSFYTGQPSRLQPMSQNIHS